MSDFRSAALSFGGGELTPEFFGRIDDGQFQTGLALCQNFTVLPHGPIANRPGTKFVGYCKYADRRPRLIPFTYSDRSTVVIEMGHKYMRFHTNGGTVLNTDGSPYEIASPYEQSNLPVVRFVQSGDVVTMTHREYKPRELRRMAAADWAFSIIEFNSELSPPTAVTGTAHAGATPGEPYETAYAVTTVGQTTSDESLQSNTATAINNLYDDNAYNELTWTPPAGGAFRYNIYKKRSGIYGYIGQTDSTSFIDDNIASDFGTTPPLNQNVFASENNYPRVVSYYEQRRVFGSTEKQPQNLWFSKTGTETNFNFSVPPRADDSVQFKLASREANYVKHLLPLGDLILFTASAVWRVGSVDGGPLTPTTVSARKQIGSFGSAECPPVEVNTSALYVTAPNGHVRELGYSEQSNGYVSGDLSLRAPHLFNGFDIRAMAFASTPYPVVWAVSTSGKLLGLTYVPEQKVGAWHQHVTGYDDAFEDVCVVRENSDDAVYVIVKRAIGEQVVRTIERFAARAPEANKRDQFFVDCGATYDGDPTMTVSGLDWLEGATVAIVADGVILNPRQVLNGAVTLDVEASRVHVGLPIRARARTLPLSLQMQGYAQGVPKNVTKASVRLYRTLGLKAGPDFGSLNEAMFRTDETLGESPQLLTGSIEIDTYPTWQDDGTVCFEQTEPMPCTILSMVLEGALGGG
jgi:hypothetical protein